MRDVSSQTRRPEPPTLCPNGLTYSEIFLGIQTRDGSETRVPPPVIVVDDLPSRQEKETPPNLQSNLSTTIRKLLGLTLKPHSHKPLPSFLLLVSRLVYPFYFKHSISDTL